MACSNCKTSMRRELLECGSDLLLGQPHDPQCFQDRKMRLFRKVGPHRCCIRFPPAWHGGQPPALSGWRWNHLRQTVRPLFGGSLPAGTATGWFSCPRQLAAELSIQVPPWGLYASVKTSPTHDSGEAGLGQQRRKTEDAARAPDWCKHLPAFRLRHCPAGGPAAGNPIFRS